MICRMGQINFFSPNRVQVVHQFLSYRFHPEATAFSWKEFARQGGWVVLWRSKAPKPGHSGEGSLLLYFRLLFYSFSFSHPAGFSSFFSTSLEAPGSWKACCDRQASPDSLDWSEAARVPHWTALMLRMHGDLISFSLLLRFMYTA